MTIKTYPLAAFLGGITPCCMKRFSATLKGAGFEGFTLTLDTHEMRIALASEPDDDDIATLAYLVENHSSLESVKRRIFQEIDEGTDAIIAQGFEFAGIVFSLSPNARQRLIAMDLERDDPAVVYPVDWNSIDDTTVFQIPDSVILHGMALTAMGTVRAAIDYGSAKKALVRGCLTVAEVQAIEL